MTSITRSSLAAELRRVALDIEDGLPLNGQANILHELERRARDLHTSEVIAKLGGVDPDFQRLFNAGWDRTEFGDGAQS